MGYVYGDEFSVVFDIERPVLGGAAVGFCAIRGRAPVHPDVERAIRPDPVALLGKVIQADPVLLAGVVTRNACN